MNDAQHAAFVGDLRDLADRRRRPGAAGRAAALLAALRAQRPVGAFEAGQPPPDGVAHRVGSGQDGVREAK